METSCPAFGSHYSPFREKGDGLASPGQILKWSPTQVIVGPPKAHDSSRTPQRHLHGRTTQVSEQVGWRGGADVRSWSRPGRGGWGNCVGPRSSPSHPEQTSPRPAADTSSDALP